MNKYVIFSFLIFEFVLSFGGLASYFDEESSDSETIEDVMVLEGFNSASEEEPYEESSDSGTIEDVMVLKGFNSAIEEEPEDQVHLVPKRIEKTKRDSSVRIMGTICFDDAKDYRTNHDRATLGKRKRAHKANEEQALNNPKRKKPNPEYSNTGFTVIDENIVDEKVQMILDHLGNLRDATAPLQGSLAKEFDGLLKETKRWEIPPSFCLSGKNRIFSSGHIEKGIILGHYAGEIIVRIENPALVDNSFFWGITGILFFEKEEHDLFFPNIEYHEEIDYRIGCDTTKFGNWIRYVRHCDEGANCQAVLARRESSDGHWQYVILIVTSKEIRPGEELIIDYGQKF